MATVKAEDLPRAVSMVTQLPKAVKNPIFARNLRSNQVSTLPRELSSLDSMDVWIQQREEGERRCPGQATQGLCSGTPGVAPYCPPDSPGTR